MHVIILRLTDRPVEEHIAEEEVFEESRDRFPDGVTGTSEEVRSDDIDRFLRLLGEAARTGYEIVDGRKVRWLELDASRKDELFRNYWDRFELISRRFTEFGFKDFVNGTSLLGMWMQRLKEAYYFDPVYIADRFGMAEDLASWLRNTAPWDGSRLYFHETYDGDQ